MKPNLELLKKIVPAEILNDNEFDSHFNVKGPGKFEGESVIALYYYDCFLNGGDTIFEISDDERAAFGIGSGYTHVYLYESEQGFVHPYFCTSQTEAEAMESSDDEEESESEYDDYFSTY